MRGAAGQVRGGLRVCAPTSPHTDDGPLGVEAVGGVLQFHKATMPMPCLLKPAAGNRLVVSITFISLF